MFTGKECQERGKSGGVHLRATVTESNNVLGLGETYHTILRRVCNKVSVSHPKVPKEPRLSFSIKAMNDTAGPSGLVVSLLLYGVYPRIPDYTSALPNQAERFEAMSTSRTEYEIMLRPSAYDILSTRNFRLIKPWNIAWTIRICFLRETE